LQQGRLPPERLAESLAGIEDSIARRLEVDSRASLVPVINATGIVIHTNLGRAPLSTAAIQAIGAVARGYSNLELDLDGGQRGHREAHATRLLGRLFPGQHGLVVNNNAAAVLLALNTFAVGKEVLISRGELVEIGGSFRIPEILERSGARLREVGTTNKTRISDYASALGPATGLILRVHPSNFRIIGFTERASTSDLAALGRSRGVPVVEDFGSGNLVSLASCGVGDEPTIQNALLAGVDMVTFSGDKLLGGPQAGILLGREEPVGRCLKNPLARALRVDKLTYAALEATLSSFVRGVAFEEVPVLRMLAASAAEIERRGRRLVAALRRVEGLEFSVLAGASKVGGGAAPETEVPTSLISLRVSGESAQAVAGRLRSHDPPVVARIANDAVLLDLRTVAPEEEPLLVAALAALPRPLLRPPHKTEE
jgi:L-seryl-tRNA(Ser) seleniumtransferase